MRELSCNVCHLLWCVQNNYNIPVGTAVSSMVKRYTQNRNNSNISRVRFRFSFLPPPHHLYFAAQLVGGFTLSHLLDKPWSQVSSPLPLGTCLQYYRAYGSAFPLLDDFYRTLLTTALALSGIKHLCKKKSLRVCVLGQN